MTRKLACPSCGITLRVAATLAAGKRVKCPKCGEGFPVPEEDELPAEAVAAQPRQRPRRLAEDEDERDEEVEDRPTPRKRRRKPKKAAAISPVLLVLLIGGAVLLAGAAVTAGVYFWPKAKTEAVAETSAPPPQQADPGPSEPAPAVAPGPTGRGREQANRGQRQRPEQPQQPQQPFGGTGPAGGEADLLAVGRRVFEAHNCTRCHSGGPRSRGPNLTTVGRDPQHTVEWLMAYVRDPRSQRPNSRMPGFAGKIGEQDLRALAAYLASLK